MNEPSATTFQPAITKDVLDKVQNWLTAKGVQLSCPICRNTSWAAFGHFVAPPIYSPGALVFGETDYPVVNLVCQNCGGVQSFSAVALGLIK